LLGVSALIMKGLSQLLLRGTVEKSLEKAAVAVDPLKNAKAVLTKKCKDRTQMDVHRLSLFLKNVKFFNQFAPHADYVLHLCCKFLRFKKGYHSELVYDFDNKLKHFYIVLEGSVQVYHGDQSMTSEVLHYPGSFGGEVLTKKEVLDECVICLEDSSFAYLTKLDYTKVMVKVAEREIMSQAEFIGELPMFKDKTKSFLMRLATAFDEVKFTRNAQVFKQGSPATTLCFIKEGEFMLTHALHRVGTPSVAGVAILCRGEALGDREVLDEMPYKHSCFCVSTKGVLLMMKKETFVKQFVDEEMLEVIQQRTAFNDKGRSRRLKNFTSLIKTGQLQSQTLLEPVQTTDLWGASIKSLSKVSESSSRSRSVTRARMSRSGRQPQPYVSGTARQAINTYKSSPIKSLKTTTRFFKLHHSITNLSLTVCPSLVALEHRALVAPESRGRLRDTSNERPIVNMHTERYRAERGSKITLRGRGRNTSNEKSRLAKSMTNPDLTSVYKELPFQQPERSPDQRPLRSLFRRRL
jgi:CRP-like cAMP-binding protein